MMSFSVIRTSALPPPKSAANQRRSQFRPAAGARRESWQFAWSRSRSWPASRGRFLRAVGPWSSGVGPCRLGSWSGQRKPGRDRWRDRNTGSRPATLTGRTQGPDEWARLRRGSGQVGGNLSEENREHIRALADLRGGQVGNVVMGSKFELAFGQGPTRIRARRITAEEFSAPFVRTPELSRLAANISDQPLIVLQGPRGYGKAAALVWTLRRDLPDGAKMFYLDPATDLAAFSCEGVPEDSVLILQDLPDSAADSLDPYAVGRIQSELRTRRCRLGITVSKAANLTALSTDFLVIELDARPDPTGSSTGTCPNCSSAPISRQTPCVTGLM